MLISPSSQIARRVRSEEYVRRLAAEGRLARHATRYMPACLQEEVFLHPRSALAGTAPELVAYCEVLRSTQRPYLAGVTPLEAAWLPDAGGPLCQGVHKRLGQSCRGDAEHVAHHVSRCLL
jgi:ATP-dependent RNA helicase DHX37/DHR1